MKKIKKLLATVLTAGLLLSLSAVTVLADEYTYKVTIDGGNQGVLAKLDGLEVKSASAKVSLEDGKIVIQNLKANDVISFDAQKGAVSMNDDSKYYIQGIRRSGRDTEEMAASSFRVTEDSDYVIAYGIKGNLVRYTVRYQDEDGNELAPSQTYYGNIGDKPVVANIYIDGYSPKALALTKTLSANEAENVFTFEYVEGETQIIETPGETITETVIQYIDGGTTTQSTNQTGNQTGNQAGTQAPDTETGEGETGEAGNAAQPEAGEEVTEIPEEDVPQDIVDLDDEETPLANPKIDKEEVEKGLPLAAGIAISVVAVAALAGLVIFLRRSRAGKRH